MLYLSFYGLQEEPFNITPDPRFLFYSARHKEAYDLLRYGIENRKGFIELVGEVGSGKTTLCRAVLSSLPKNVQTALVLNPTLTETQLLRAILNDLGLTVKGRDRLSYIEQLNSYLLFMAREGNNVALFIDEAQDLEPGVMEQIRLLSNLETDQQKLMQIVLIGQPELRDRLSRSDLRQLRQRILVRCRLDELNEKEVAYYISHRLKVAGAREGVAFDAESVHLVHKYSKGLPRLINSLCDRAMMAAYLEKSHVVHGAHVRKAIHDVEVHA